MTWLASILIILGYYLVVRKYKLGFLIETLGCLIYIFSFFNVDNSVVLTNVVFTSINLYGFYSWRKDY